MKIKRKSISLDVVFSALIILLPFLYQYKGIGNVISLGEVVLAPFIAYYSIKILGGIKKREINKPLLYFYLAGLVLTLFNVLSSYFSLEAAGTIILRLVYYMLLVFVARRYFCFKKLPILSVIIVKNI